MAIANTAKPVSTLTTASRTNYGAMAMVTTLFFMWGFLTSLNDILIPHLKAIFDLNFAEVLLVQFTFFSGYVVFAFPAGKLVERIGYQKTMVTGLLIMALGAFLFVPAASAPSFPFFLTALIILAAGITALQVSANPYVSVLGPPETASSRLNLTQAFNSLGTTIAPNFGSLLILSSAPLAIEEIHRLAPDALHAYRLHEAATVKVPYIGLALALIALAVVIALFRLPKIAEEQVSPTDLRKAGSIWKRKHLVLGAVGIFLYVGAEVAIGSFLVNYFVLPDIGAMTVKAAGLYLSLYWMCAMIGRFVGSAVLQKIRTGPLLGATAIAACLLVSTSMLSHGRIAVWTIILVGLFNSVMFPSIFTLGIAELGPLTGEGSGLLIAAIVGGAIIPELEGLLADAIGIHYAFILPALCYIYIAFYGFRGSKPAIVRA
ncbi:MAG TPA: L-fucose:H+ symporter permease [Bryobacteraceae bacterium]|nr:L-fucose:H+ symporter permease [Bryobacteraceae bacterium]